MQNLIENILRKYGIEHVSDSALEVLIQAVYESIEQLGDKETFDNLVLSSFEHLDVLTQIIKDNTIMEMDTFGQFDSVSADTFQTLLKSKKQPEKVKAIQNLLMLDIYFGYDESEQLIYFIERKRDY